MTIYRLTINAFDYWYSPYNSGVKRIEKFFTTKEKAEKWINEHPKYIYCGFNKEHTEAKNEQEMPTFEIDEIIVE